MTSPNEEDIKVGLEDEFSVPAERAADAAEHLERELKKLNRTLLNLSKRFDKAAASALKYAGAMETASGATKKFNAEAEKVEPKMAKVDKSTDRTTKTLDKHSKAVKKTESDYKKFTSRLGKVFNVVKAGVPFLMAMGKGLALVGAVSGAAGAAQGLVAFAVAASNVVAFAALMPSALLALVSVFATMKMAVKGVGNAFKAAAAGDTQAFNDALKNLTPSAQKFVKNLLPFIPMMKNIQKVAQESFFAPIIKLGAQAANNILPSISKGVADVGANMGKAAASVLSWFASFDGKVLIQDVFMAGSQAASAFGTMAEPILQGVSDVVHVMADNFKQFTFAIGAGGAKFGMWLSSIAESGKLEAMFQRAVAFAKQLWQTGKDLWTIFSNLGSVLIAGFSGTGILTFIHLAAQFVSSAEGLQVVKQIFDTLSSLGDALMPLFTQLASILISSVIPAIKPIVEALAPAFVGILQALGQGLQMLLPMWPILAQSIQMLLKALEPILPALGALLNFLGTELGLIAQILGAVLAPVLQLIIAPIQILGNLFAQYANALLPKLMPLFNQLTETFMQMVPPIQQVIQMFSDQFAAILPQLMDAIMQVTPVLLNLVIQGVQPFLAILQQLVPFMPQVIQAFMQMLLAIIQIAPALMPVVQAFIAMLPAILPVIPLVVQMGVVLLRLVSIAFIAAAGLAQFAGDAIGALNRVVAFVAGTFQSIGNLLSHPFEAAKSIILGIVGDIKGAIDSIASKAQSALSSLNPLNAFRAFGGPVVTGQTYTVGEIGPELYIPKSGSPFMIGEHGMEDRTFPSQGTIVPSFMLEAMERVSKAAERRVAAMEARAAQQGDQMAMVGAARATRTGEATYQENNYSFSFPGAVFNREMDIEKAVRDAIRKANRDDKERR